MNFPLICAPFRPSGWQPFYLAILPFHPSQSRPSLSALPHKAQTNAAERARPSSTVLTGKRDEERVPPGASGWRGGRRTIRQTVRVRHGRRAIFDDRGIVAPCGKERRSLPRSEEHTSELQSLIPIS